MSRRNENAQTGYFGEELAEHLQPNLVVGWLVEGLSEKINWRLGPSEGVAEWKNEEEVQQSTHPALWAGQAVTAYMIAPSMM